MRKTLVPLIALLALCGCDNPEDFQHPENPKKQISITPGGPGVATTTTTTTTATDGTTTTTTPAVPAASSVAQDNSPAKSGDAPISGTFDKLNISAALETDITVGGPTKVTVDCSQNSYDNIKFEIKDTTLNITTQNNFSAQTAKISITMPALVGLSTGKTAMVKVSGLTGTNFACSSADQSSIDLVGTVDNVVISADNGSLVRAKTLESKTGVVASNARSVVEVKCTESIIATSSGESVISIFGTPRKITKNKTGKSFISVVVK